MTATAAMQRATSRLRPRHLLNQLTVLVTAEIWLFASYRGHDAGFHWATHFLVGLTAAALFNLSWLIFTNTPAPGQFLSILIAHLVAMFPDFLFGAGVPHYQWMDIFLAHNAAHEIPGEDRGWLAIGLVAFGAYTVALARWLAAQESPRRKRKH